MNFLILVFNYFNNHYHHHHHQVFIHATGHLFSHFSAYLEYRNCTYAPSCLRVDSTIHWKNQLVWLMLICAIVVYPVDRARLDLTPFHTVYNKPP